MTSNERLKSIMTRLGLTSSREPRWQLLVAALAFCIAAFVLIYPFWVCRYPPLTDLPFHGAQTAILRHYWDPSFHFKDQYTLHPLEVPYLSMYAVGALLALVLPILTASKAMAIITLAFLPCGLAILFWGMKKSPLWGLLGCALVWGNLTHWGFLNYVGAIGLYAMSLGFALRLLDAPSRRLHIALLLSVLGVFITHVYRLPFTILSLGLVAVLMYPATRRIKPIIPSLLFGTLILIGWNLIRSNTSDTENIQIRFEPKRLQEISKHVFENFSYGPSAALEQRYWAGIGLGLGLAFIVAAALFFLQRRHAGRTRREIYWGVGVSLLPLLLAGGYLVAYLSLPMEIGLWWYVYPREITTCLFISLALMPDLPKAWAPRLGFILGVGFVIGRFGWFVGEEFRDFDRSTKDFTAIVQEVPKAPKLMYLVFDHSGSTKRNTPYIHLPAWVQAERGGALGFHFVGFNHSPIRYRKDSNAVPPPFPERWEWTPQRFNLAQHGGWFDTFLVRRKTDPSGLFRGDPTIQLVAREGSWWLYRRENAIPW